MKFSELGIIALLAVSPLSPPGNATFAVDKEPSVIAKAGHGIAQAAFAVADVGKMIAAAVVGPPYLAPGFVTVAFDPPATPPDPTGYIVHYGVASGVYTEHKNIGLNTQATINGLKPGVVYYFAATAYDHEGNVSDFSNEVTATIPTSLTAWSIPKDIKIVNLTNQLARDPTDFIDYRYYTFAFKGDPDTKFTVETRLDENADWHILETFAIRPVGGSYKKVTVTASYRFANDAGGRLFRVRAL